MSKSNGTVKFFNTRKGFGFIECEGSKDIFVHANNLIDQMFKFKERKTKPFYSLKKDVVGEAHQSKF